MAAKKAAKLTPRQKLFCIEYLRDFNGTQAAIRAGYTKNEKAAGIHAGRLLGNARVKAEINAGAAELEAKRKVTVDRLYEELETIALADPGELYDDAGRLIPIKKLPEKVRRTLASVEEELAFQHFSKGQAAAIGTLKKIKWQDKQTAIVHLLKLKHKVAERLEVNTNLSRIEAWLHKGRAENAAAR